MADKHYVPGYTPFWQPGDPLPEDDGYTPRPKSVPDEDDDE